MTIVEINSVPYGSTAMIARNITNLKSKSINIYFAYSWTKIRKKNVKKDEILIGTFLGKCFHIFMSKITGYELYFSYLDTLFFIKKLKKIKPKIIHFHNLHCWYLNIPLLFKYIKKNNIKVVWTLHDCWSITGHCTHFEMSKCNKWKELCENCPLYREYPQSFFDNSKKMYTFKKKWFTYLDDLTLITPSKWLKKYVEQSYLGKYNIKIINNGIDLNIFKPYKSNFRKKYNCEDKYILLGVALDWGIKKGLNEFIKLSKDLPSEYQIILVGTTKIIDQQLPKNIISIHKTESKKELAEIYSSADIFINPTFEDNFPTVNLEALACGLPVMTYETGGSPEMLNENCGIVVEKGNYNELKKQILSISKHKLLSKNCIMQAKKYDYNKKCFEYIKLFNIVNNK